MKKPEVWFAIPSASPARCRATLPAWREMGYRTAVLQNFERGEIPADIAVWSDQYPGWPGSINRLCREVVPASADIIVSGGDDMLPDPRHRAGEIGRQFLDRFPGGFGVMQPHGDEFLGARHYCGSPWLGRGWISRAYGGRGPMPTQYRHNWADNELYWVARCLGALWERPDLTQRHEHFTRTGEDKPVYWSQNVERNDRDDVQMFIARAWQKFPGHEPLGNCAPFDHAWFAREYRGIAEAYWMTRYGASGLAGTCEARMREALQACAARGHKAVAIYGAGTHTRSLGAALLQPPVRVVCIIDDDRSLRGKRLWNYPVVSVADALTLGLDAVILSSNSMEETLARAAEPLSLQGAEIIRLYSEAQTSPERKGTDANAAA